MLAAGISGSGEIAVLPEGGTTCLPRSVKPVPFYFLTNVLPVRASVFSGNGTGGFTTVR